MRLWGTGCNVRGGQTQLKIPYNRKVWKKCAETKANIRKWGREEKKSNSIEWRHIQRIQQAATHIHTGSETNRQSKKKPKKTKANKKILSLGSFILQILGKKFASSFDMCSALNLFISLIHYLCFFSRTPLFQMRRMRHTHNVFSADFFPTPFSFSFIFSLSLSSFSIKCEPHNCSFLTDCGRAVVYAVQLCEKSNHTKESPQFVILRSILASSFFLNK